MKDTMYISRQERMRRQKKTLAMVAGIIFISGVIVGFLVGRGINVSAASESTQVKESHKTVSTARIVENETAENGHTTEEEPKTETPRYVSLGEFRLTAYCPCEKCCGKWGKNRPVDGSGKSIVYTASGKIAQQGYTVAADKSKLPFGTKIYIDGHEYEVQDVGGAIKENRIDVYFESHQDALEFGVQYAEVFVLAETEE